MSAEWNAPAEVGGEIRGAISISEFSKHTASLHVDGDIGFSKEYEAIQNECIADEHSSEHSLHPDNKTKNRYLNITACKILSLFYSSKMLIFSINTCGFIFMSSNTTQGSFHAISRLKLFLIFHFSFSAHIDDHSRVRLRSIPGQNKNIESYINGMFSSFKLK